MQVIEIKKKKLRVDYLFILTSIVILVEIYRNQDRLDEARKLNV